MLQSDKTCLRAVERRDLRSTRSLRVDPAVSGATLGRCFPVTELDEEAWFEELGRGAFPVNVVWTVAEVSGDQAFVGLAQLVDIDWIHRTAWFGIWIDPAKQGRGHGREATLLGCRHAFGSFGLRQLRLRVLADNARAQQLYRKAGFVPEAVQLGAALRAGQPVDVVIMRLDPEGLNGSD